MVKTKAIVFLSLIVLSLSVQIKITNSCPSQSTFPEMSTNTIFKATIQGSPNGVRAQILKIIREWQPKYDQQIRSTTTQIEKNGNSQRCKASYYWFQQKISQITRVHSDSNSFLPGTVIQTPNPTNFANGIIPVYIPDDKRNPLNITIFNGLNTTFINVTSPLDFKKLISQLIVKNANILNQSPIQIFIGKHENLQKILKQLGLSSRVYEQLIIAASKPQQVRAQEKIVITLFQKFFSTSLSFFADKDGFSPNLLQTLLNSNYTLQDFIQTSGMGFWRAGNIPHVIKQANYGRLLVLSFDSNSQNKRIVQRLQSCFANGVTNDGNKCFEAAMNQIRSNPTLRYYVAGVDPGSVSQHIQRPIYKEIISWKKVFFNIDSKTVEFIRPLSARMVSFLGKGYSQIQNRYFSSLACAKKGTFQVKVDSITGILSATIKRKNDKNFGRVVFRTGKAGIFDIDSDWQTFQIKFVLEGKESKGMKIWKMKFSSTTYSKQVSLSILIDGQTKMAYNWGNPKDRSKQAVFTYSVDPTTGTVS